MTVTVHVVRQHGMQEPLQLHFEAEFYQPTAQHQQWQTSYIGRLFTTVTRQAAAGGTD